MHCACAVNGFASKDDTVTTYLVGSVCENVSNSRVQSLPAGRHHLVCLHGQTKAMVCSLQMHSEPEHSSLQ